MDERFLTVCPPRMVALITADLRGVSTILSRR